MVGGSGCGAEGVPGTYYAYETNQGVKAISGQPGTHGIMEDVRDQLKRLQPSSKTLAK